MKITKPSELREGMKLRGKWDGVPISGHITKGDSGRWCLMPHGYIIVDNGIGDLFTDLESVEGIRAAKEGDVLVDDEGGERKVLFCSEYICVLSLLDDFATAASEIYTYQELEREGWKLKDQEQPAKDKEGAWLRNKVAELIGDLIEYDDYPERRKMFRKVQMDINDEIDRLIELVDIRLGADLSNSSDYSIKTIKIDNKIYKLEPID